MRVLVTGAAGFIGYHLTARLLAEGHEVVAVDSLNTYYDASLKRARLAELGIDPAKIAPGALVHSATSSALSFAQLALEEREAILALLDERPPARICHFAAQAGVRYSIDFPQVYVDSNVTGFLTALEAARRFDVEHLVYGSSSSVYGERDDPPFRESDRVDAPISFYAATKRANELMAHAYAHLHGLSVTGLRFFTVYGPFGRPDMAYFKFVERVLSGRPIDVYNAGDMARDFTYVDDIVEGVARVLMGTPAGGGADARGRARVYNIGRGRPVRLLDFIEAIEAACGRRATKRMLPMQPGDVSMTWADCSALERDFGFSPSTSLDGGVASFVAWYRDYYGV